VRLFARSSVGSTSDRSSLHNVALDSAVALEPLRRSRFVFFRQESDMRNTHLNCLLAAILSACTSSVGEEPADSRHCERLRDHLVDLQVADIHIATGIDREAHRRAMAQALGSSFVSSCIAKLTETQVDCALDTHDAAAAAACTR
jgi:hypothetical protein